MTLTQRAIWLLASGGNILILAAMIKIKARINLPWLWYVQWLWFSVIVAQDILRLDYSWWLAFDAMGIGLYVLVATILYINDIVEDAWLVPIAYLFMATLKIVGLAAGFEATRSNLLIVRQFIGIAADYWFAWCLFRGMIRPRRYFHEPS